MAGLCSIGYTDQSWTCRPNMDVPAGADAVLLASGQQMGLQLRAHEQPRVDAAGSCAAWWAALRRVSLGCLPGPAQQQVYASWKGCFMQR